MCNERNLICCECKYTINPVTIVHAPSRVVYILIIMNWVNWLNYRHRSFLNAGCPDEIGAHNFRTNNSIHVTFLFEFVKINIP